MHYVPTSGYQTVLFDLDGTLLNTLADLASSTNRALASRGFPARTVEEVRTFVGNGIKNLIDRAVPAGTDEAERAQVLAAFKEDYAAHCADETAPYEGILPMLEALRGCGVKTAIVSNKADFAVGLLAKQYFGDLIDLSRGERPEVPKKPAPDMLYAVMRELGADPATTLFVGDSDVDLDTAVNADIDVVLVDWGFRERALLDRKIATLPPHRNGKVVSSIEELLRVIL